MEIENIIQLAKSLGFTKQGEMFSIKNLLKLAQYINQNIEGRITESTTDVREKKKLILQALFNHHPILVPYDRDFNNEPCMKNGVKAHWALDIIHGENKESKELYIFAVQGKSLKPHIWDLDQLLESNNQLRTVDPAMLRCKDEFCLPSYGSLSSLQGKILILNNK
ncbi:hypothetical protein HELRODRAFT_68419 [Helobdella robusta]|uniref:Actin maturation protease n=1 Tax=Helobdella robusta TaxID=6412 RepID=T1FZE4_HELRO|nr:hypothetical protein HELRODRAFT_68419 [Helobdella robusta]ESN96636.1 hypothetical protein HELRODRAFT_68419 [Helobdella robusta]